MYVLSYKTSHIFRVFNFMPIISPINSSMYSVYIAQINYFAKKVTLYK